MKKRTFPLIGKVCHSRTIVSAVGLLLLAGTNQALFADPDGWTPESHYGADYAGPSEESAPKPTPKATPTPTPKPPKPEKPSSPQGAGQTGAKPDRAAQFAAQTANWPAAFQDPTSPVQLQPLTPEGERAVKNLQAWAQFVAKGDFSKARALPVAGSWNVAAGQMSPDYLVSLIQQGHHVAVAFQDPHSVAFGNSTPDGKVGPKLQQEMDTYYRPALEFAKAHKLPIVFRGWNWGADPVAYQTRQQSRFGVEFATEDLASVLVDGTPVPNQTDPLGPIKAWEDWGRFWFGNVLIKELQRIYPDPPLVVFLNNNEAGDIHEVDGYEKSDRFVAKYGTEPREKSFVEKVILEGTAERYAAMFAAAKDALISPEWRKNTRFVAYNTIFGASQFGRDFGSGDYPSPSIWFDNEKGLTKWRFFDGSMPEMYDNDWQPVKRDYTPWSMQGEMGPIYAYEEMIRKERPDFISGMITWDGAVTNAVFRGRRGSSKPFLYASRGLRWGFERYEGWITFGLWTVRPTLFWEFRAAEPLDSMRLGTWLPQLRATDQVWNSPLLREFWEGGRLVPNRAEPPFFNQLPAGAPDWLKQMDRWFLLTSDANPPREEWTNSTILRVFAQAIELGEKPNRRWLLIAHAPERPTASPSVTIPDFGPVKLPSLSQTCSFFLVEEKDGAVQVLMEGGPAALELKITSEGTTLPSGSWFAPGTDVGFDVSVAHAPGQTFDEFVWTFGDGKPQTQKQPGAVTHRFEKEGTYIVTVEARTKGETKISEQIPVFIGAVPAEAVAYDLRLDQALAWEGPWVSAGEDGMDLITYRHLPNRGQLASPIAVGGKFVEDPERGRVFEMSGSEDGIFLQRGLQTVMRGGTLPLAGPDGPNPETALRNRTVSFWFKAEDVQTRQVLFAEGFDQVGMNIYLDGGNLYAGCFAPVDGTVHAADPVSGYNWPGEWISTPVEAGKWVQVTWVLKDADVKVEPDKQALYINGKLVGRAPAAALPTLHVSPRIGRTNMNDDMLNGRKRSLTRFHDQAEREKLSIRELNTLNDIAVFRGRLSEFRYINAAESPE